MGINIRILVVDDSPTQVSKFKALLEEAGYSVDIANDGVEAMDYLNSGKPLPSLILTDIVMPNMDGFDLCANVKESYKNIPVIILTVHNNEENLQKAFNAGAVDYLAKPFSKTEMLIRIDNTLKTQSAIMKEAKAKREFKESSELYATLVSTIPEIIYRVDANGKFFFVSESVKQLGYSPKELIGKHFRRIVHPADYKAVNRHIVLSKYKGEKTGDIESPKLFNERRTAGRMTRNLKLRLAVKKQKGNSKEYRFFNIHFSTGEWDRFVKEKNKSLLGSIGIACDITENLNAEKQIRKSAEKHKNFLNNLGDLVYETDINGNITYVNKFAEEVMGLPLKDIINKPFLPLFTEESQKIATDVYQRTLKGEVPKYELTFKNGRVLQYNNKPLISETGETTGVFGMARDITERKKAEDEIKSVSTYLENIVNSMSDGLWVLDLQGNTIDVSPSMVKISGYDSKEELTKKSPMDITDKDDQGKTALIIKETLEKESFLGETSLIKKNGDKILISVSTSLLKNSDKKAIGLIGIIRDITRQKEIEKELNDREITLRNMYDSKLMGFLLWDADGEIIDSNDTFLKMLGYTREEFFSKNIFWQDITPEEYTERDSLILSELASDMEVSPFEDEYICKDGSRLPVLVGATVLPDPGIGGAAFVLDITERKQAKDALRKERDFAESLVNTAQVIILVLDLNGRIVSFNTYLEEISGFSLDEVCGKDWFSTFLPVGGHAEIRKLFQKSINTNIQTKGNVNSIITKDGRELQIEWYDEKLIDSDGNITGLLAVGQDVSMRIKLEDQLRQSEKMEAIGQLSGGIAHDFNNILAVILANAEASLKNTSNVDRTRKSLKEILSAGYHAKQVVKQLLLFARKTAIKKVPLKINILIRDALKLVKASIPSTIKIHTYISKRTGTVYADPTQINQILLNLCTNATHAMEETGGTIKISLTDVILNEALALQYENLTPGRYVQLTVADTGHGIKAEHRKQLFEPYFTTKSVDKGTGLGLAVTHGIVKDLGGNILVESGSDEGTIFKILFPQTSEKPVFEEKKQVSTEPPQKENAKILLIDDEESVLKSLRLILQMRGFSIEGKTDPAEALELLRKDPKQFDLIITDMTMPGIRGDELAVEALKIRHDIPIILATGYNDKIDEEKAKRIGIRKYIEKPFTVEEITQMIHEALRKQRPGSKS